MHIQIMPAQGAVRVDDTVYALADVMTPGVLQHWRADFGRFVAVAIAADGETTGTHADSRVEILETAGDLRAAIVASPAVAARIAGKAQREAALRAAEIKAECTRRIYAELSDATQKNLNAYATDLALQAALGATLSTAQQADIATAQAARAWVLATVAASRAAIQTGTDPVWPALPQGVAALAARF